MVSMVCRRGYTIKVLSDGTGGYFKGAVDSMTGATICRLTCVVSTENLAKRLPINRQFDRKDVVDCNGGKGCFE